MESIYEIFSSKQVGEKETLTVNGDFYEFTKIAEYKYLVEHTIFIKFRNSTEQINLNNTMTTMEASKVYEILSKE